MSDDVNYKDLMIAKALTKEELDQEAVWAERFEHWWDAEGQYHRAGGNDYCKTFAWWAWLNREQKQQAIIDSLKAQLNNMEACYIEVKKEVEDQQKQIDAGLEKIRQFGKEGCLFPEWLTWAEKALRGEHEQ